jgi:aerobic-type carbon monoxide dehydrogenase small subunit (CoxS/CutS family)
VTVNLKQFASACKYCTDGLVCSAYTVFQLPLSSMPHLDEVALRRSGVAEPWNI